MIHLPMTKQKSRPNFPRILLESGKKDLAAQNISLSEFLYQEDSTGAALPQPFPPAVSLASQKPSASPKPLALPAPCPSSPRSVTSLGGLRQRTLVCPFSPQRLHSTRESVGMSAEAIVSLMPQLTVAGLWALSARVTKFIAVSALDLARLGAILREMSFATAVTARASVTASTVGAIAREVARCS